MNTVCIMGNLTKDPELRYTQTQKSVASFTVAVSAGRNEAYFIPCVAWENTADFVAKYFKKGQQIAVSGELTQRTYESNGQKRTVIEVLARKTDFCGRREEAKQDPMNDLNEFIPAPDEDELPF